MAATYEISIAGVKRALPLMEVAPGVRIAVLNILGDTEVTEAAAKALVKRLPPCEFIVTAEAKSIPLAYAMSVHSGIPYIVLRKTHKLYMGDALSAETLSITTGKPQTLYLDAKDRAVVAGRRVIIVDDVISTGSTSEGMRELMRKAGATVVAESAILTEGDKEKWKSVIALGHLPVFVGE